MEMEIGQVEIVRRGVALQGDGHGSLTRFLNWFNEEMGIYAISYYTIWNWLHGKTKPQPRILQHALDVYRVGDPREVWARELMQAGEAE
jgi:hypothetical protein